LHQIRTRLVIIFVKLDPDFSIGYLILAFDQIALERIGEAEMILQEAANRKLENPDFGGMRYSIAFLKSDKAGMEREVGQSQGEPGVEDYMSNAESSVLAYSGHLEESRRMSRRAVELANQIDHRETAAFYESQMAMEEALFGNALTSELPVSGRRRQRASKSGLSMFGLLDYRGWPRRRLHSPRAERMKVRPPSPPSAQSVQTKKKPPVDLAISP